MKIGTLDVETEPIAASVYLRISRCDIDATARALVFLGLAVKAPPAAKPSPKNADAFDDFADAILDHYIDGGATFEQVMTAAGEVVAEVSTRLGFTKAEAEDDAGFSEAPTEGGSAIVSA